MVQFTANEVRTAVEGKLLKVVNESFTRVTTDTRKIERGDLFIAIVGEHFDGHDFIEQAIEKGAAGVIISCTYDEKFLQKLQATVVWTADTLIAYQQLAKLHRQHFSIPIIAITGSNGKTTTKDLTAAVLSSKFNVLKTQANFNNEIGLPLTLYQLNQQHDVAVVEMGMRGLGQITQLAEIALPTIGIVTNVGETHMELLGSLDNIAKAKSELVEAIGTGTIILNADNAYVKAMREKAKGKVILFGCAEDADVRAVNIQSNGKSTIFDCIAHGKTYTLQLPLVGQHNVSNALAAIAVGIEQSLTFAQIQQGLHDLAMTDMRFAVSTVHAYTVINDAYNASPMSMIAAIDTLAEIAKSRKIAVLGDMLELGSVSVDAHKRVGEKLAVANVDAVVTIGEMAVYIAESAKQGGVQCVVACTNHAEAGETLQSILQAGDTILFKGSRGMKMEKVIELI